MRAVVASTVLVALVACAPPPAADNPFRVQPQATTPQSPSPAAPKPAYAQAAKVVRVVDGDTVVLTGIETGEVDHRTGGRKSRLIGVDTPEVYGGVECLGREASAFTKRSLQDRDVLVDFDVGKVDRYGRALVYLWLDDGSFFNASIVAEGFAMPLTVPPNVRYADLFVRLAREARAAGRGLWGRC